MNELLEGVRVFRDGVDDDPSWLMLSTGGELLADSAAAGLPYVAAAAVPRDGWRVPDRRERALLCAEPGDREPGYTVSVLRMPDALLEPLRALRFDEEPPVRGTTLRTPDCEEAGARALEQLRPFIESTDDLVPGLRLQRGGLRTSTAHPMPEGWAFIGTHVDRWHDGTYGCTEHAQLSINLGARDRYFAFLNLPVAALTDDYGDPIGGWLTIGRDFVERHAGYPFVRVRVRPGEAYLAPTENLVHDVSLEGSELPDVCFNLRGRLRLP